MELATRSQERLGTLVEIKVSGEHEGLLPECFEIIGAVERAYSRFLDSSELSILNKHVGEWQPATKEMLSLLATAEEFRNATDGNFDVTLKSVLDNLGYDKNYSFTPKAVQNAPFPVAPEGAGYAIDPLTNEVLLNREIDFGGFGKGLALDKVARYLEANGAGHYYINAGGDIYAKRGEGMQPWVIMLEHPDDATKAIGTVELDGKSIAGSAPNRRKWAGGLHHLINAKTRMPAQGVKAVFVTAATGIEADAYATAVFTAGFEEGIELSKRLPLEVLLISSDDKMYESKGFGAKMYE